MTRRWLVKCQAAIESNRGRGDWVRLVTWPVARWLASSLTWLAWLAGWLAAQVVDWLPFFDTEFRSWSLLETRIAINWWERDVVQIAWV
jgi:hypothetical protein